MNRDLTQHVQSTKQQQQLLDVIPKQFPRMLYNKDGDYIIVNNREEMNDMFMQGWSTNRSGLSELEVVEAKISEVLESLFDLHHKKAILVGGIVEEEFHIKVGPDGSIPIVDEEEVEEGPKEDVKVNLLAAEPTQDTANGSSFMGDTPSSTPPPTIPKPKKGMN